MYNYFSFHSKKEKLKITRRGLAAGLKEVWPEWLLLDSTRESRLSFGNLIFLAIGLYRQHMILFPDF